jgi:hypothetical protein
MDPDFTALASRVAARAEVLGCVILSRDGLVLGAFPPHGEQDIMPGLLRFAALGDPDRGFAQFADELWAYVREGSYAAFAVAEHGTRPGILLDYLEQALLVAEEARQFGQAMSEPVHVDLSQKGVNLGRKLRAATSEVEAEFRASVVAPEREATGGGNGDREVPVLSPVPAVDDGALDEALAAAVAAGGRDPDPEPPVPTATHIEPVEGDIPPELVVSGEAAPPEAFRAPSVEQFEAPPEPPAEVPVHHAPEAPGEPEHRHDEEPPDGPSPPPANPDEIDRVALAREFAQLLQEGPATAE